MLGDRCSEDDDGVEGVSVFGHSVNVDDNDGDGELSGTEFEVAPKLLMLMTLRQTTKTNARIFIST